jgi:antitoxin component YwqK of YwqJK toxin-antitoxin module
MEVLIKKMQTFQISKEYIKRWKVNFFLVVLELLILFAIFIGYGFFTLGYHFESIIQSRVTLIFISLFAAISLIVYFLLLSRIKSSVVHLTHEGIDMDGKRSFTKISYYDIKKLEVNKTINGKLETIGIFFGGKQVSIKGFNDMVLILSTLKQKIYKIKGEALQEIEQPVRSVPVVFIIFLNIMILGVLVFQAKLKDSFQYKEEKFREGNYRQKRQNSKKVINKAFKETLAEDGRNKMTASKKVKLWEDFLHLYQRHQPMFYGDNSIKKKARERIQYWQNRIRQDVPVKKAIRKIEYRDFQGKVITKEGFEANGGNGRFIVYNEKGQKIVEHHVRNDLPHGKWISWYENGQKKLESYYKNGKLSGKYTQWYKSGKKQIECEYREGESHGKYTMWYENGQKSSEGEYKEGHYHGKQTEWYKNGKKRNDSEFNNGNLNGKWIDWYENGQKRSEGEYRDNKPVGKHVNWYENGQKMHESEIKNGKPNGKAFEWYENGQRKFESNYENGKINGKWLEWYSDGTKKGEGTFKNGTGRFVIWYKNGQKKEQREIKNSTAHGKWIWWDRNGKVVKEEIYQNDKLVKNSSL